MSQVKVGDTVKVNYSCFSEDGEVIKEEKSEEPIEFTIGKGELIPGFEEAILGMEQGEEKQSAVPMEKAFGPRKEDNVMVVEREKFPKDLVIEVGQQVQMQTTDGNTSLVRISDFSEDQVTLDVNHPLAGKNLIFNIKLLEIV
jgi:peptidylprolyl isomerase